MSFIFSGIMLFLLCVPLWFICEGIHGVRVIKAYVLEDIRAFIGRSE